MASLTSTVYPLQNSIQAQHREFSSNDLIYSMGTEAKQIYLMFPVVEGRGAEAVSPNTTFDEVIRMFTNHFNQRVNTIHERANFHKRKQQE
ncbi:hypothetical protein BaRGS_00008587 [Batillaria attramentaria]|uniref:Uncharacterized protein n=1 Tax=Batillaria attramentaria TaxID=370345 RepID=A0ABD0LKU6_9CAEN